MGAHNHGPDDCPECEFNHEDADLAWDALDAQWEDERIQYEEAA